MQLTFQTSNQSLNQAVGRSGRQVDSLETLSVSGHLEILTHWNKTERNNFRIGNKQIWISTRRRVARSDKEHAEYSDPVYYGELHRQCNQDIKKFPTWTINHPAYDSCLHYRRRRGYLTRSPSDVERLDRQRYFRIILKSKSFSPTPVMSPSTLQSAWFHKKVLRLSNEPQAFSPKHEEQEWKSVIQSDEALHA